MKLDTFLDRPMLAVIAVLVVVAGVLLAFTAVMGGGSGETTFVKPATPSSYIFMWAIEEGHASLPDGVSIDTVDSLDRATQLMASGRADIAMVPLASLPFLRERNPDVRVLPYQTMTPTDMTGIYTRTDTNITEPSDLEGKRIALPRSSTSGAMTLAALKEGYGIDTGDVTVVDASLRSTGNLLAAGDVDAAFMVGYPPADEMRPVLHPYRYFDEQVGGYPLLGVYVADVSAVDEGIAAMDALQRSGRIGTANVSAVAATFHNNTGRNLSTLMHRMAEAHDGEIIVRLSGDSITASQTVLDHAHDLNITERTVDIASMTAR